MSSVLPTYDYVKKSIERTSRWAERGLKAHRRPHDQGLFGIVQERALKIFAISQLMTLSAWISQATLYQWFGSGRNAQK